MYITSVMCIFCSFPSKSSEEQDTDLPQALPQSSEFARNSTKFGNNVGFTVVMPEGESSTKGLSFHNTTMNVDNLSYAAAMVAHNKDLWMLMF